MKVILINPPQIVNSEGVDTKPNISIPLGALYMAAYLRKQQWKGELKLYDARLSAELATDNEGIVYFGDSWEQVEKTILEFQPNVIGICNMFSQQIPAALRLSKLCKEVIPSAITVLGGPHASSQPLLMLKESTIDYVVMGEGEERFYRMLCSIEAGEPVEVEGVLQSEEDAKLLKSNKKAPITFIQNLDDALPMPAYDLVDVDRYFYLQSHGYAPRPREWGKRAVTILTSRGCPHQCIFCSIQATMGYKFRSHSPEYLREHIEYLISKHDIDYIHFEDDNFTHDIPRFDKILDVLNEQNPRIKWDTPNGVRADSWTLDLVKKSKESGCQHLCIAIESSVQRVIDEVVKKRLDLNKVEPVMQACKEVGLSLNAFYVLGLPGERADEIKSNIDWAIDKYKKYGVYPTFSPANPLPGTEFYDIVNEGNLYHGVSSNETPRPFTFKTSEFDPDYCRTMYRYANRRKRWITVYSMLTSFKSFKLYAGMSIKNPWHFLKAMLGLIGRAA
tara:strand:+ start:212 stop:1723 length:1512 start_codon:yes stop_codon:yes gene_type:complete